MMKKSALKPWQLGAVVSAFGATGIVGCDGASGVTAGVPADVAANIQDFLVAFSRQVFVALFL